MYLKNYKIFFLINNLILLTKKLIQSNLVNKINFWKLNLKGGVFNSVKFSEKKCRDGVIKNAI